MMAALTSIILAAGEGTRLRPHTVECPKCLVPVNERPLIHYQLDVIRSVGIDRIVIVGGYLAEQLRPIEATLRINADYNTTNMVHSLFCARDLIQGDVLISYGDIVYSRNILERLIAAPYDISVVIDREWEPYWQARFEDPLLDAETLKINAKGCIQEIGQTPRNLTEIEGQYIGLMKFSSKGVDALQKTHAIASGAGELRGKPVEKAYMTDLIQAMIDCDTEVWPVHIDGAWVEIDTVEDLSLDVTCNRIRSISNSCQSQ